MSTPKSVSAKKASAILALGQKSFFLRPICLDRYLRQLDLTESAREVFWYHWGIGYRERTLTTHLSIEHVAQYLSISPSSVCRAYEQLVAAGLIVRRIGKVEHGGYGIAETTIDLPDAVLVALLTDNPDRQRGHPNQPQPAVSRPTEDPIANSAYPDHDLEKSTSASSNSAVTADDTQALIDDLNRQIQHWNAVAIQCSEQKDIPGYRQAVRQAEQVQRRRDALRAKLASDHQATTPNTVERPKITAADTNHPCQPGLSDATRTNTCCVGNTAPTPVRQLSAKIRAEIAQRVQAIKRVSNPPAVTQEIIYSIECGAQSKRPISWAIHAALALIQSNRWRTPYGFNGGAARLEGGVGPN